MSVRKTETRIPQGLQPSDLGEAILSADGKCSLISFSSSPLAINRANVYVVFVTDTSLAANASSYEWSFIENENPAIMVITEYGEITYTPSFLGTLTVAVRVLDSANTEKVKLILSQSIFILNSELEVLIAESVNKPGPGVSNIEVARELINDHNSYYQGVSLQTPESGDGFKQFVFNMASDGIIQVKADKRAENINTLALTLNSDVGSFSALAVGLGVCNIRLALLAMVVPGMLNWTELPEEPNQNSLADEQVRQELSELDENKRIDLFNLVRFPKSNIIQCARIIEQLRNKYFGSTNFNDVLTGMSGTRAVWIIKHFRKGPLKT